MGGAAALRAVIFDLWDTLVAWPADDWSVVTQRTRALLELDEAEFDKFWRGSNKLRSTRPMRQALVELGVADGVVEDLLDVRRQFTRDVLVPIPGALETLAELREREIRVGLISVCTDEVPALWPDSPFADRFDSSVFSCSVGLAKPDPRIYHLACDELGVAPEDSIFVGDGANDELAGAEAVGMKAVLFIPPGRDEPFWPEVRDWQPRIRDLRDVLDLIDERSEQ